MKKATSTVPYTLSLLFLVALVFTGCGKDKKTNTVAAQPVQAPKQYELPPEEKCPVWNGRFMKAGRTSKVRYTAIETKKEGDRYFYSFAGSGQFFEANGQAQEVEFGGKKGLVLVTCEANIVTFEARPMNGRPKITRYEYLSPEQFIARSNASRDDSGLYDLVDQEIQMATLNQ